MISWGHSFPREALLYDATRGNTRSRREVFFAFAVLAGEGSPIPPDISKFIASQMMRVMSGDQSAAEMFNPEGTKLKVIQSWPRALVEGFGDDLEVNGDIKNRFKQIGNHVGKSAATVDKMYYDHDKYEKRIYRIQELLDEGRAASDIKRKKAVVAELQRLTTIVS